jgi:hypothetical protein
MTLMLSTSTNKRRSMMSQKKHPPDQANHLIMCAPIFEVVTQPEPTSDL